jgi:hypothetical protein
MNKDKAVDGLSNIKQGDIISGTIVAKGEQVTINFHGQQVTASKEVLKNTVPGEVKTFEVVKVSKTEIELKLMDQETSLKHPSTFKAELIPMKDWETVLNQKEQNARLAEKEQKSKELMDKLQEISDSLTESDYDMLEQEGFPIETMTIKGLYQAISRVKAEQSKNDTGREATFDQITEEIIAARLKEENLPVTDKNISEIKKALLLSDTAGRMDDKTERFLIDQDIAPTIENIYKAFYSGGKKTTGQKQELTETEWKELLPQVKAVIQDSGYEVNDENLREAKWLIENKLPLTNKTFSYKKVLEEIKSGVDSEMVFDRILEGMKNGVQPKNVSLDTQDETALLNTLTDIRSISPEAVSYAVSEGIDLTIRKLAAVQTDLSSGKITPEEIKASMKYMTMAASTDPKHIGRKKVDGVSTGEENTEDNPGRVTVEDRSDNEERIENNSDKEEYSERVSDREVRPGGEADQDTASEDRSGDKDHTDSNQSKQYEAVKAQRQMEEIRLKMTLEAASRLEKKGIAIETQKLEKVVEELRKLENSYYRKLLEEAEVSATTEAMETIKNTSQSLEQLRYIPISTIGATLSERGTQTLPGLLIDGLKLQSEYAKAGTAYETLMTVPNSEYGDSIRKAFSHMDSLLNELNLESTEQNQRAVRILGYNQMEITTENIEQVKTYDSEVTDLIKNLHPAITVRMIKEGMNPLNMTISELNDKIAEMKEEQGITSEEKFSTYLHKLEKEEGITPEERKAYIGIYRLLYNVEKSDGAALGSVIKADREVTLNNLLTAVQTGKKGRLDAIIDDEFGTLTQMTRNKESIAEQLGGFRVGTSEQSSLQELTNEKEIRLEEQTRYLERILKQITDELSPDKLLKLSQNHSQANTLANAGNPDTAWGNDGIWNRIKDISAEQLLQKLQQEQTSDTVTEEIQAQKVEQLRELCGKAEQSIRFLNDFQMSSTPQNITLANHILANGTSPIVKLLKKQNENDNENLTDGIKELKDLSDTINDKSSMNEAYEALEEKAKQMLEGACSEETLDSRRLAELRSTAMQMSFLRTMASREFYQIPVQTAKGITNVNLTILRGSESGGKVAVTVNSEQLGDIKAEFSLKQQTLKGFISCDNQNGIEKLQAHVSEIEKTAEDNNIILKQMDFGISSREKDTYNYQNPENGQQSSDRNNQTERMLYRIAKSIVQTVRLAEDSEVEISRAVS